LVFIPDYWEFLTTEEQAHLSVAPVDEASKMLFTIEAERNDALGAGRYVLDRTVLTILVTNIVRRRLGESGASSLPPALLRTGRWISPSVVIYLDVPFEMTLARWRKRSMESAMFVSQPFDHLFRRAFAYLSKVLPIVILSTQGQTPDNLASSVLQIASSQASTDFNVLDAISYLEERL
jgi:thymidylate kinase